ncbi:hypothetical protein HYQ45_004111 [Verticillium longisporum]|uniref:Uncharacterized protein n=1 Tax=Verticillium longisporum TaxID=100787 RepID=A0A8I3AUU5_VERLO|nr:hypothetical protein HYQ45_004111 [Verticillium longisporum]
MDSDKQLDSAKASSIEVMTTTDRVDHASEKPERRLSHSTEASKNSGKKTAEKRADDQATKSKVRWRRAVCSMYRTGPAMRLGAKRP